MQPGPLSRWHREGEPPIPNADPRPVHAVMQDGETPADECDLSGPLAIQEKRTALFTLPAYEPRVVQATAPPDPEEFSSHQITQPAWLLPDTTNPATASEEVAKSSDAIRATAQPPTDPFEANDVEEVIVSDDAPAKTPPPAEVAEAPVEKVAPVQVAPVQIATAAPIVVPVAAPVALPPTATPVAPTTADEYYAQAEHAAAEAASTNELATVVQTCQEGLGCQPDAELSKALRSLAAWACNRSGEIESDRRREDKAMRGL